MPVITFDGSPMDADTKRKLIAALTDAVVSIIPDIPRSAYYVILRTHPDEDIGVGGLALPEHLATLESRDE
jgi:phenylpyruvate tautomerase PptA (4-oxalocrotonate tautomerase family)